MKYHLHFWGQALNDGWIFKFLKSDSVDYWFNSKEERGKFKALIKYICSINNKTVVFRESEGDLCDKSLIAKLSFAYNGVKYCLNHDFGFGFSEFGARYMLEEGNYCCDCNRSLFLQEIWEDFPDLECGREIKLMSIEFEHREKTNETLNTF